MSKVSPEIAGKEVSDWLDSKKIFDKDRQKNIDSIELLEDMVCEGVLVFNEENHEITHNLLFEIGEEAKVSQFVYKGRLNDRMLQPHLKGLKPMDMDGRMTAYICALTSQVRGIVNVLDSQDKKIASTIAAFFL